MDGMRRDGELILSTYTSTLYTARWRVGGLGLVGLIADLSQT